MSHHEQLSPLTHRPRVAIVGAGIAGISAAYHLRDVAELTLFEQDSRPGGHAHTVEVLDSGRTLGIDTAFVVFNPISYPGVTGFLDEIGVEMVNHEGGFNFFDLDTGLEFTGAELAAADDQRPDRFGPDFQLIRREARRFHQESRHDFLRKRADMPLGEYLDTHGYSETFRYGYVVLLVTAVWSVPAELIWEMPTSTIVAFFMAHGENGLGGQQVDWRTVRGGSISYIRRALSIIDGDLRLEQPVIGVRQDQDGVRVTTATDVERFDYAVVATHADQAIGLLENPTPSQRGVLEGIRYNTSTAILHTDPSVLPVDPDRWQSWNYGRVSVGERTATYVVYYMNRLQGFDASQDYFVSLDYPREVRADAVIEKIEYTHPVIDMHVRNLQKTIYRVNDTGRVKLCGSYFHSKRHHWDQVGSHEAAFSSGIEASAALRRELRATHAVEGV